MDMDREDGQRPFFPPTSHTNYSALLSNCGSKTPNTGVIERLAAIGPFIDFNDRMRAGSRCELAAGVIQRKSWRGAEIERSTPMIMIRWQLIVTRAVLKQSIKRHLIPIANFSLLTRE